MAENDRLSKLYNPVELVSQFSRQKCVEIREITQKGLKFGWPELEAFLYASPHF